MYILSLKKQNSWNLYCTIPNYLIYVPTYFNQVTASIMNKIWASFIPNFGGSPFESKTDHITSYKTALFTFILDGLVLWVSYQSFLYTELSTPLLKAPFHDLESFSKSKFTWVYYWSVLDQKSSIEIPNLSFF